MPIVTFDKQHLDEGFMFLAKRGEVGCLPDDVFVITEPLFGLLEQSGIPFTRIEKGSQQGDVGAESEKKRATGGKVSV
jgi:hypothetical protein